MALELFYTQIKRNILQNMSWTGHLLKDLPAKLSSTGHLSSANNETKVDIELLRSIPF